MVGINTAIISGANNIGYAVPISTVKQILPPLKEKGRVERGYLGVSLQPITRDLVERLHLNSTEGAIVAALVNGPAAQAGIQPGDAILKVDGKPVRDPIQLTRSIGSHPPGATVKLEVMHDGKSREVEVKLGQRPDDTSEARRLVPRGRRPE